jgi:hypothetical protein
VSRQGHIGQQPLDAVPSFGGSTTTGTEGSYRLWDPAKVPTPSAIVRALDRFVVGQEATKKVRAAAPCWAAMRCDACLRRTLACTAGHCACLCQAVAAFPVEDA